MDRYTKFLLTIIALGLIGINYHFFKDSVVKPAYANSIQKVIICDRYDYDRCAKVNSIGELQIDE